MAAPDSAVPLQSPPPVDPLRLDAFISYSRRDRAFVTDLTAALEARGKSLWIDADDIPPGAPWRRELGTAIEAADGFIFVMSPHSVASPECAEELRRAVELGKRLVPVAYAHTPDVPESLGALQWISVDDGLDRLVDDVVHALDADYEWVHAHTRWLARALRWEEGTRDRSLLLRGSELRAAEEWLASQRRGRVPAPTELHTRFILESRRAEKRRLQIVTSSSLAAVVIAVGLAIVALLQRGEAIQERNTARAGALAATSISQMDVDPARSLVLALRAAEVERTAEVDEALRRALADSHVRLLLRGHAQPVTRAAFSPDGQMIATAARDRTSRLWDTRTGRQVRVLRGHEGAVASTSWSPDGRRLLTTGEDGTARLWATGTGRATVVMRLPRGRVLAAVFRGDGRRVVTAGSDGTARLWDTATGEERAVLRHGDGALRTAAFTPDGRLLLTAGDNGVARLWDVRRRRSSVLDRRGRPLADVQVSADGAVAATVTDSGRARLWRLSPRRRIAELPSEAFTLRLSRDGRTAVTTSITGAVRLWSTRTGAERATLSGHGNAVLDAAFSPDGRLLVTAGSDRTARVWDAVTGASVAVLRGHDGAVHSAAFSPDARRVVTAGDRTARVWNAGAPTIVRLQPRTTVSSARLSPDGRVLVTTGTDLGARLWDSQTAREIVDPPGCSTAIGYSCLTQAVLAGHKSAPLDADFDATGTHVVTAGADATARVWETFSGKEVAVMAGHDGKVLRASFSASGDKVVTASDDGTARVWRSRDGEQVRALGGFRSGGGRPGVRQAILTPRADRVLTASADGALRLWDVTRGQPVRLMRIDDDAGVLDAALDPAGKRVAAPVDNRIGVWNQEDAQQLLDLRGHDGLVFRIAYSPDGAFIASAGQDTTARVWDAQTGAAVAVMRGHTQSLMSVSFSHDGNRLVTAAEDGTARVWPCEPCARGDALVRRVRARVRLTGPLPTARSGRSG